MPEKITCENCASIADYERNEKLIPGHLKKLTKLKGRGNFYRGEEYQRSDYWLHQCPECKGYFQHVHDFYSDPKSTMGLGRDEDDWWYLGRMNENEAKERLEGLE